MLRQSDGNRGVIALITVILIGSMIVTIGIAAAFMGQTESVIGRQTDLRNKGLTLTDACLDEAAYRLKLNSAYTGGTVPVGSDSCSMAVTGSGSTRTVTVTATVDGFTRQIVAGLLLKQNTATSARGWAVDSWVESDIP